MMLPKTIFLRFTVTRRQPNETDSANNSNEEFIKTFF